MDGDIVRHLADLGDAHGGGLVLGEDLGGEVGVVGHDLHAEHPGDLAHPLADAAEAQHAQGFAPELTAHKGVLVPLLVDGYIPVGGDGVPGQLQHLADGQLGHGVAVEAGGVKDLHALLLGVLGVDVVQAHGAHADDLQALGGVQHLFVDLGVHPHDEHVHVADLGLQLVLRGGELLAGGDLHVLAQFLSDGGGDNVDDETFHKPTFLPVYYFLGRSPDHTFLR